MSWRPPFTTTWISSRGPIHSSLRQLSAMSGHPSGWLLRTCHFACFAAAARVSRTVTFSVRRISCLDLHCRPRFKRIVCVVARSNFDPLEKITFVLWYRYMSIVFASTIFASFWETTPSWTCELPQGLRRTAGRSSALVVCCRWRRPTWRQLAADATRTSGSGWPSASTPASLL